LVWDIFVKLKLLDFAIERSRITGLALDRMGGSVSAFENLYLPKLHRAGFIAPNRGDGLYLESPGGYVLDSTPGFFEHVLVLDFKSLYPSIIRTFAIDPLALHQGLMASQAEETVPGFMGARFGREQSILPSIIAELAAQREKAKAEKNTALSNAIKIIMASFYGVLGTEGCRLADSRLTASITLRGHEIILTSSAWVEQQGYQVIYGDTDSLFVWLNKDVSQEQAHQIGKKLAKDLNLFWKNDLFQRFGLQSHLEIQYETHYVKFFMPALRGTEEGSKKRYAGMVQQGDDLELVFKGLEAVRSDWTAFARNTQKELYRRIFQHEPYAAWLYARVQDLLAGKFDDELIYRKRLRQPLSAYAHHLPPHAQAAQKLEKWRALKSQPAHFLKRGGTVEYRLTLNGPEPLWPDGSPHSPIDYSHYLETQLRPICTAIFQFTGDDFSAITGLQLSLF
jgi:DNA polymerase-2